MRTKFNTRTVRRVRPAFRVDRPGKRVGLAARQPLGVIGRSNMRWKANGVSYALDPLGSRAAEALGS